MQLSFKLQNFLLILLLLRWLELLDWFDLLVLTHMAFLYAARKPVTPLVLYDTNPRVDMAGDTEMRQLELCLLDVYAHTLPQ